MAETKDPIIIKKYANRRLYNTGTSTYVTLEDLAQMVRDGDDFEVMDAKSGDDITHSVLTQIIFEQENKGQNLLPIKFLRQLIGFYGDSIQGLVPGYLDMSMNSFSEQQEQLRRQMATTFNIPFDAFEEQTRQNMEAFERAFKLFTPFAIPGVPTIPGLSGLAGVEAPKPAAADKKATGNEELELMRSQMAQMQKQLDSLTKKGKA
jgi:polyhydroxyalkanoate synthesis repressor PhaR